MSGESRAPFPFEFSQPTDAPPRRRRRWPWLVAILVVLALMVGAFFAGEWIARDLVSKAVTQQVTQRLGLPAGTRVDVDVPGSLLFQLATGTIGEATVAAPDVELDGLSGDVSVTVRDLRVWDGPSFGAGDATVRLDTAQVQALMSTVDGFPAETLGLADPDVTMTSTLSLFGASIPVGVALTPSASQGQLVLTPASFSLGNAEATADDLRDRLGPLSDAVLRDWQVCIAQYLPAAIRLTDMAVADQELVARFDIDGVVMTDSALQAKGTCA